MTSDRRGIPQTAERVSLLFALLLVLLIAFLAWRAWSTFSRSAGQEAVTLRIFNASNALLSSLKDAETGQRGFLLTGEDRYLDPYRRALTEIPATLDVLDGIEAAARGPDQSRRIDRLRPLVQDKLSELGQTIDLRRTQGSEAAVAVVRTDRGKVVMDQIRAVCEEIEAASSARLTEYTRASHRSADLAGLIGALGSAAVFVMLLLSTIAVQRGTYRRQQLIESLRQSEEQTREARDWLKTTLGSIGDGVVATDANGRVTLLNAVAQSLTGWTQEEAFGKPLEEVFVISNAQTGAIVENPAARVLREGRVIGLANHTRLTAKNGKQIPIDDSAAPIRDGDGAITGVVLVFRDVTDREEARRAEQRSIEQFRLMADNAPVLVWMAGPDQLSTWFNQQWLDFVGRGLDQELGNGWTESVHPDDLESRLDSYRQAFEARWPFATEYRLKRHDGEYRWMLDNGIPLCGDNGNFSGYIGSSVDITARKTAEEALRNTNAALQEFADIVDPAAVLVRDPGDRIIRWTSGAQALYGFSAAEAVGRIAHELLQTSLPAPLEQIRQTLFDTGRWEGEVRHQRPNGDRITVASVWALYRDKQGAPAAILEVNTDITERKRLEEDLRASRATYRAIGESINYGIWICAPDGRNTYASESFLNLVGLTHEQCYEFGWNGVLHPDDTQRAMAAWKECVLREANWDIELRFRGVDGLYHWILSRGVPVRNEHGQILCWAGINLDIDRAKAVEEALRATNEQLSRANEDLNQFAFAASHDLQEPLRMITNYSQLLIRGYRGQLDGEAAASVGFITEGTRRMRDLLADLLAYAQLTAAGEQPVEDIDLNGVFQQTTENLRTAIQETQSIVTSDPLPIVRGHEPHFLQLLQNLIGNSIKYRSGDAPRIHVSALRQDRGWRFAVADNGIGIDPEYHHKIFGVFKRLHGKTIPGTGIGLAICQRVVERYGGRIWVESEEGQGATFYFTLPVEKEWTA